MNTIRKSITLVIILTLALSARSQSGNSQKVRKNGVFFEAGGTGLLYSVNYERIVFYREAFKLSTRLGVEYIPPTFWNNRIIVVPAELTAIFGKKRSHFEWGVGGWVYPFGIRDVQSYYDYSDGGWINGRGETCPNKGEEKNNYWHSYCMMRVGYRWQHEKGFTFRAAIFPSVVHLTNYKMEPYDESFRGFGDKTPHYSREKNYADNNEIHYKNTLALWAGASIGYAF